MREVTVKNVPVRYIRNSAGRIQTKMVVIVGPGVTRQLEMMISIESSHMPDWKGWQKDRPFYMPLKRLKDGNAQLALRSTKRIKCKAPNNAEGCRADVTFYLEGYANVCNQGVRARLLEFEICEKEKKT